jgi:hypothetical protein
MTVHEIKAAKNAVPFVPFRIHYPGGSPISVLHPDFMSFSLTGRIAYVTIPEDRLVRVDVALITSIEELEPTVH